MNYEQMLLLDVLVNNLWKEESYKIIFRIDSESDESEICIGSFTRKDSQGVGQYEAVDTASLKRDFITFLNQNKGQEIQDIRELLKKIYASDEDQDVKDILIEDSMLVSMILFLHDEETSIEDYLREDTRRKIIYNAHIGNLEYAFYPVEEVKEDVKYMPITFYDDVK